MDAGSRTLNPIFLFVGILLGFGAGFGFSRWNRLRRGRYLAHLEYWVLGNAEQLPDLTKTMEAVVGANPYGPGVIGPAEGLLFSDIRFKISIILAAKNPSAAWLVRDELSAASGCKSALRVQYSSESKLDEKKHLQFCVHVADALARQVGAPFVYDVVADRLWDVASFQAFLGREKKAIGFDDHVVISETEDHEISVKGLVKVGVPDLQTLPLEKDKLMLGRHIVEGYARASWDQMAPSDEMIEAYGDEFFLVRESVRPGLQTARLMRRRAV